MKKRTFFRSSWHSLIAGMIALSPLHGQAGDQKLGTVDTSCIQYLKMDANDANIIGREMKVRNNAGDLHIDAFGKHFIEKLLKERVKVRKVFDIVNRNVIGAENYIVGLLAAQIAAYNTLLEGGPGTGKTLLIHLLNGYDEFEVGDPASILLWYKVMSEQTQEFNIFGGQKISSAEQGVEDLNLLTSIVAKPFANIDEVNNAQPALLTSLFPLLNTGERRISIGGRVVAAATRSIHFTSNLSALGLRNLFAKEGRSESGAAFLSRLQIIMNFSSWDSPDILDRINERKMKMQRLKHLARVNPDARKLLEAETIPKDVDWAFLEFAAGLAINTEDEPVRGILREVTTDFRTAIKGKVDESLENSSNQQLPFYQTHEIDKRKMVEYSPFIKVSVLLDLLLSNIPDQVLAEKLSQPIVLTPLSLWRLAWLQTSVGGGRMSLVRGTGDDKPFDVHFREVVDEKGKFIELTPQQTEAYARNQLEVSQDRDMWAERQVWLEKLQSRIVNYRAGNKIASEILAGFDGKAQKPDIEFLIMKYRR